MNINMQSYWYSPAYVIYMAEELVKTYGQNVIDRDTVFQRVGEMKGTAILALTMNKVDGNRYFMQASEDEFPDVFTLYQKEIPGKNVDTKYQTIEVVEYRPTVKKDVVDFILDIKLINPKKSYDEQTMILCYIRKAGTYIDFDKLYAKLKKHKFRPSLVYILGNKMGAANIFLVSQVWPTIHHETINYIERTKSYPLPHRIFFKKGVPKILDYKTSSESLKTNPYEVFNLNEVLIRKKYGK